MKSNTTSQWHGVVVPFDHNREKFIELRKQFGFGYQKDVADALGLSDANLISRFESGEFELDPRTFTLFGLITDSHPSYLLTQRQKNHGTLLIEAPVSGKERRKYRINAKLSGEGMANILGLAGKSLVSRYENEKKSPSIQNWTLFLLITNQHPYYQIFPKYTMATYRPMIYK